MYDDINALREREKELMCLYRVTELLKDEAAEPDLIFRKLVNIIPEGWQYPGICNARIIFEGQTYTTPDFFETRMKQSAEIRIDGSTPGHIDIFYSRMMEHENPFLPEEQKLLNTIAGLVAQYIFRQRIEKTVAYLSNQSEDTGDLLSSFEDEHWQWRRRMAEYIAEAIDLKKFGLKALYLIGSAKQETSGPASDIDLMVHFAGEPRQKMMLKEWIEGWSRCLSVINYQKTGYKLQEGLIDLHIITDHDIEKKNSYAAMIGSLQNSARLLKTID